MPWLPMRLGRGLDTVVVCDARCSELRSRRSCSSGSRNLANDVSCGREALNFSEWDRRQDDLDEDVEAIRSGGMPPWYYVIIHLNACRSAHRKAELERGLEQTFRRSASE